MIWALFRGQGRNLGKNFVGIFVQTMTLKRHFEINWPLVNNQLNSSSNSTHRRTQLIIATHPPLLKQIIGKYKNLQKTVKKTFTYYDFFRQFLMNGRPLTQARCPRRRHQIKGKNPCLQRHLAEFWPQPLQEMARKW